MKQSTDLIPDIFVIGAMKAGTSTLFRDFLVSPDIARTKEKEVNFLLTGASEKIREKYAKQYQPKDRDLLKCDVSPKYAQHHFFSDVPQNMFRLNPNAKIIYITRDPVERIISHLHHNLLRDRFAEKDIETEVFSNKDYIMCSKYYTQINKFLEYFSMDKVLVLTLEEMISDSTTFCKRLNQFLQIDSIVYTGKRFNVSEDRYKICWYDAIHNKIGNKRFIRLYHYLWYVIHLNVPKPTLSPESRSLLTNSLAEDTYSFVEAFKLDVAQWKNFSK